MYRPTVRYDDIYRDYVDKLFRLTTLDRNQIIRAALFISAHTKEFQSLIAPFYKSDVPPPSPLWVDTDHGLWLEQTQKEKVRGRDVNYGKPQIPSEQIKSGMEKISQERLWSNQDRERRQQPVERRDGKVRQERKPGGGLRITIG